jgi:FkbM family methyltransferase
MRAVGLRFAIELYGRRLLKIAAPVSVTCGTHVLTVRPTDSDVPVLAQIFGDTQYDASSLQMQSLKRVADQWRAAGQIPLIIDAGSNVGYSSLYFANAFPSAVIIAVEPDAQCVELSRTNTVGCSRIEVVHAALWKHNEGVQLENPDVPSWARRVSDSGPIPSVTLESLTSKIPGSRPFLLKLDIEGSEKTVCDASSQTINQFPCILIEPHDWMIPGGGCLAPLFRAISDKEMDTLIVGENLMFFDSGFVRDWISLDPDSQSSGSVR